MDPIDCLIERWILEYEIYELWKKFSDNLRITQTWQMMFFFYSKPTKTVYNTLNIDQQDDSERVNRLLLKIMTSTSSASKLPNDSSTDVTPLEEVLMHIDQLSEFRLKEVVKIALLRFKKAIKVESVIICLRCHKVNLGKTVYERVWCGSSSNPKDSNVKLSLETLFKDSANLASSLNQFNVSELSESCKQFFSKYFNTLPLSFLIKAGEKIVDTYPTTFGLLNKKKKVISEVTKYKHFLIQCWIAEYFSHKAWKYIDELSDDKYEWLLKYVSENSDFESKSCLLIRFMFKYCERNKSDDTIATFISPTELCLELLEKINNSFPDEFENSIQLVDRLKSELKKYAVLIWCKRNMYSRAKMVYDKLFLESEKEEELKSEISSILDGSLMLHNFTDENLDKALKNYLSKVFEFDSPYLVYIAENVIGKSKIIIENWDLTVKKPAESNKRLRTSKKLPDDFISTDSIEYITGSMGRKSQEFQKFQNLNNESPEVPSKDEDPNKRSHGIYEPSYIHKEKNVEKIKSSEKKHRIWLEEEEELIYRGAKMFGVGNWATIARELLVGRSNVEVKDKWKIMMRQGKLRKFIDQYGPIPGFKADEISDTYT